MDWQAFRLQTRLSLNPAIIENIYTLLAEIDGVKNSWHITGKLLPQTIQRLTHSVIVTSTGSSNRIEGNRLTDQEVEALYKNLRIKRFKNRDEQEIAGYLEMLEFIFSNYNVIQLTESSLLKLHDDMLLYSDKDAHHKGQYKFGSNRVEAKDQSGKIVGIVFDPTPPYLVKKEMQELVNWYHWGLNSHAKHPLLLIANFIFEYLAIHPFQDGNGRTSRLLTNLMLLQQGYHFISFVSHEKIIEEHKMDYYLALNKTQSTWKTEAEDISPWLIFFLNVLVTQARDALKILRGENIEHLLSQKQLLLWQWANELSPLAFSRKDAVEALNFPERTVEAIIKKLYDMKHLQKIGTGRATRYVVANDKGALYKLHDQSV